MEVIRIMGKNIVLLTKEQAAQRQRAAILKTIHSEASALVRSGQGVAVHSDKRTKRNRTRATQRSQAIRESY